MSRAEKIIQITEATTPGYTFLKNVKYFTKAIEPAIPNGRYHVSVSTENNRQVIISIHFEKPVNLGDDLGNRMKKFIVKVGTGFFKNNVIEVDLARIRGTLVNGVDVSFRAMKEISNVDVNFKGTNVRSKLGNYQSAPTSRPSGGGMGMSMRTIPSARRYDDED